MVRRRHPQKSAGWLTKRYWTAAGKGIFSLQTQTAKAKIKIYPVMRISAMGIRRYVKIKADANPYLPEYAHYFWRRRNKKESKLLPAMSAREYRAMVST